MHGTPRLQFHIVCIASSSAAVSNLSVSHYWHASCSCFTQTILSPGEQHRRAKQGENYTQRKSKDDVETVRSEVTAAATCSGARMLLVFDVD